MTNGNSHSEHAEERTTAVSGMYENWFLDYASYVILERAVPAIEDGLKPVQRRILHAMYEMDDGRFNKAANIIGSTMQYHPHGDASISDALVNLGQKEILIDTQGNWGDIRTGDSAAAARYIEARLSKFALEVAFNPKTTNWQLSYDGRKKEPITLPMKFPLLLVQGAEGIAVGLATKILPHNFCELIRASIDILKGKSVSILPDFPTGGLMDASQYNEGQKGGKVRVRAKIEVVDNKMLLIKEIPFGTTTSSVIDSIIKASEKGQIKIKKITDNTAKDVEIEIQLQPCQSPDVLVDALYACTECEVSISPNACVIIGDKPKFISVNELLRLSTQRTMDLLKQELEILKSELLEKILFSSLEKIFIEQRIYRQIEECDTWEAVIQTIDKGLTPYKPNFYRQITQEDIIRLTEIKIKRISRYDSFKADEEKKALEADLEEAENNLANLTDFTILYFQELLKKYGKGRERKTEIRQFDTIQVTKVVANNAKLYVNRKDGFVGWGLKKDEFVCDCSDIDDIIVFRKDGKFSVSKIAEKTFVGKDIIHVGVFIKGDERMVYNTIYLDGESGISRAKRFQVLGITRDKEYDLTMGSKHSQVLYFSANPNGEAEMVTIHLSPNSKAKIKQFDFDFVELEIKGRNSQGNIVTKYPIKKVTIKREGISTLPALSVWYDESVGRLNTDSIGTFLGKFKENDKILVIYKNGEYELTNYELSNRYESSQVLLIEKFNPNAVLNVIYYDAEHQAYYVKRFHIETITPDKRFSFIGESVGSKLIFITTKPKPIVEILYKGKETKQLALAEFIDIKGWKSLGNKLPFEKINKVSLMASAETEDDAEEENHENKKNQLGLF
ncbi:MAG: DNA gyrase/topoisomerase IV subunit A [Flammeovirgaceae bacterium]